MSFNIHLARVQDLSGQKAFDQNQEIATAILEKHGKFADKNELGSGKHYTEKRYGSDLLKSHFTLISDDFIIDFQKEYIILDDVSVQNPQDVFKSIKNVIKTIIPFGFLIEHPTEDVVLNFVEGIQVVAKAYSKESREDIKVKRPVDFARNKKSNRDERKFWQPRREPKIEDEENENSNEE